MSIDFIHRTLNSVIMEDYPPCVAEDYRFQSLTELYFVLPPSREIP